MGQFSIGSIALRFVGLAGVVAPITSVAFDFRSASALFGGLMAFNPAPVSLPTGTTFDFRSPAALLLA